MSLPNAKAQNDTGRLSLLGLRILESTERKLLPVSCEKDPHLLENDFAPKSFALLNSGGETAGESI